VGSTDVYENHPEVVELSFNNPPNSDVELSDVSIAGKIISLVIRTFGKNFNGMIARSIYNPCVIIKISI